MQAELGRIAAEMLDDVTAFLDDGEREALAGTPERMKARLLSAEPRAAVLAETAAVVGTSPGAAR